MHFLPFYEAMSILSKYSKAVWLTPGPTRNVVQFHHFKDDMGCPVVEIENSYDSWFLTLEHNEQIGMEGDDIFIVKVKEGAKIVTLVFMGIS